MSVYRSRISTEYAELNTPIKRGVQNVKYGQDKSSTIESVGKRLLSNVPHRHHDSNRTACKNTCSVM